jgi:uncharacterized protein YbjT (DUF2867 family)
MILVVGATGVLGRATVHQLLAQGLAVRALVRRPEQARDLEHAGAEVVLGDLTDGASLARACRDVDAVLAAAHAMLGRGTGASEHVDGTGHRSLIDAAKLAGVTNLVYTSIMGAAPDHPVDFWRTKYAIEQYLKASGLRYTILRPAASMEHHAHDFLGKSILQNGKTRIFGRGNNPTNFVAGRDVARVAVLALTDPRATSRIIDVGGPENLTKNQVAAVYGRLSGCTPRVRHVPRAVLHVMSRVMKPLHPGVSRILQVSIVVDQSDQTFDPSDMLQAFPIPLTPLEAFVRERIAERDQGAEMQSQGST